MLMRLGIVPCIAVRRGYEIDGNKFSTLMQELKIGMLSVGAGCTPNDVSRIVLDLRALLVYALAKTLHTELL